MDFSVEAQPLKNLQHNTAPRGPWQGTVYGRGVYFARDAQYSVVFAGGGGYKSRPMYLAKVLVGQLTNNIFFLHQIFYPRKLAKVENFEKHAYSEVATMTVDLCCKRFSGKIHWKFAGKSSTVLQLSFHNGWVDYLKHCE
ncbi:hypothetical protein pdam_00002644 [Pocillopora damicornis]|uniref:PARP catalytic domain-containing protein n=1 Tax=Pocillopora damicornis TaxID=46731 RepID=A0A3M6U357_POCDA|nr:hypothetical protein pdam_00002644 [Pocillopora damicornis]